MAKLDDEDFAQVIRLSEAELLADAKVHENTKAYFRS